jgi:hypothetical protein
MFLFLFLFFTCAFLLWPCPVVLICTVASLASLAGAFALRVLSPHMRRNISKKGTRAQGGPKGGLHKLQ